MMNRRKFFGAIAAACGVSLIAKPKPVLTGSMKDVRYVVHMPLPHVYRFAYEGPAVKYDEFVEIKITLPDES